MPRLYLMVLSNNRPVQPAGEIHKGHLPPNKVVLRNKFDSKVSRSQLGGGGESDGVSERGSGCC